MTGGAGLPVPPLPERGDTDRPWIVDQRPGAGDTVQVTWATDRLLRIVLTIPRGSWLDGEHNPAAAMTAAAIDAMLPPESADPDQQGAGRDDDIADDGNPE